MESLKQKFAALAVAAALVVVPAQVDAQDCTAQLSPSQIEAGSDAVLLTVTLSEAMSAVESIDAGESGIEEASSEDIPRTAMSAEDEEPSAIQQGEDQSSWTVWLNTADAEAGTHPLTFVTSDGTQCTAEVEVVGQ